MVNIVALIIIAVGIVLVSVVIIKLVRNRKKWADRWGLR